MQLCGTRDPKCYRNVTPPNQPNQTKKPPCKKEPAYHTRKCDVSNLTRLYLITACDIKLWSWKKWGKWTSCQDPIILDDDHLLRRNFANIPNAPTGFHSQLNAAIEGCERRVQHSGWVMTPRHLWIYFYILTTVLFLFIREGFPKRCNC